MVKHPPHHPWVTLTHLREDTGRNKVTLAHDVDLSEVYIRDLEAGRRLGSPAVLARLADLFGMTVTELVSTRPDRAAEPERTPR